MKQIFTSIAILLLITSCHKDGGKCEKWQYYEICTPKKANVFCDDRNDIVTNPVCNDDLDQAAPGATVVIYEDDNIRKTRHYIQKAE